MRLDETSVRELAAVLAYKKSPIARPFITFLRGLLLAAACSFIFMFSIFFGTVLHSIHSLPDLTTGSSTVSRPSSIYDSDGNLIQMLLEGSEQELVSYDSLPKNLVDAIVSSQDSSYWDHQGVSLRSTIRDSYLTVTGRTDDEVQTITERYIRNTYFVPDAANESLGRLSERFQTWILAIRLEKMYSKEEILSQYLSGLYFGTACHGISEAALRYFGLPVSELSLSQCCLLAAAALDPVSYNPFLNPDLSVQKQREILDSMLSLGMISLEEYREAVAENTLSRLCQIEFRDVTTASYFVESVIDEVIMDLVTSFACSATQAEAYLRSGGLSINATLDSSVQQIVDNELSDRENYSSAGGSLTGYSLAYALSVQHWDGSVSFYNENDVVSYHVNVLDKPAFKNVFNTVSRMKSAVWEFKAWVLADDDTVLFEKVTAVPEPQASVVVMDQENGNVLAIAGGRGGRTSNTAVNRASSALRQPGSVFSVLADYAPALEIGNATLATVKYDSPYTLNDQQVMNWWGTQYLGYNNLRQGIKYSMNIISAKCINDIISPTAAYWYASEFGISTLTDADRTASISLGKLSQGVTNLDITAAYAAIADEGVYHEPIFYSQVFDADGNKLLDNTALSRRVIKSTTAELLTSAMKDAVSGYGMYDSYGIEPTGSLCRVDNVDIAGKSGTSADSNDVWFTGFSTSVTCSIWAGYDNSRSLGSGQTFHKRLWKKIMTRIHENREASAFSFSGDLEYYSICSKSGLLAIDGVCNAENSNAYVYQEAFVPGTQPTEYCNRHYTLHICEVSGQAATEYCPEDQTRQQVYFRIDSADMTSSTTLDTAFIAPALASCSIHSAQSEVIVETSDSPVEDQTEEGSEENLHTGEGIVFTEDPVGERTKVIREPIILN